MSEYYTIIHTVKCGEIGELVNELEAMINIDPRHSDTADITAVHIDNKFIEVELREFGDGTREYAFRGV